MLFFSTTDWLCAFYLDFKKKKEEMHIRLYLQVFSGALRLFMQSYREPKQAAAGFALFDHRKALIYIKSTARQRPVIHGQHGAE